MISKRLHPKREEEIHRLSTGDYVYLVGEDGYFDIPMADEVKFDINRYPDENILIYSLDQLFALYNLIGEALDRT